MRAPSRPLPLLEVGVLCGLLLAALPAAAQEETAGGEPVQAEDGLSAEPVPLEPLEPLEPADAGTAAGDLVPLFDPATTGIAGDAATGDAAAAGQPTFDGSPAEPASSGLVPLFDPLFDPLTPPESAGSAIVPLYEPGLTGRRESTPPGEPAWDDEPAWDEEATWSEAAPGGGSSFDLEEARRLLAAEMTAPGGEVPLKATLDVVTPGALDRETGASALRGENELGLDLRSVERFRWQCRNELGRRDVTLFANGTVRLRRGPRGQQSLQLDELTGEELLGYLSRLSRIQRSRELHHDMAGGQTFGQVDGELGASCQLFLRLPDLPPVVLTMPRLEVPQLGVAQLIGIADELAAFTRPLDQPRQVKADYRPRTGDRLRRKDGHYFRVIGPTADGSGVELEGLQEPIRIFYRLVDLPLLFAPAEGEIDESPIDAAEPEVREIVDAGGR